ncbi:MAG: class I SAM-dependent methyltransferase [Cyanobacteria bacterium P01_E01_bin.42]
MDIGVLKERKQDERRVALQPCQAQQLIAEGHQVWVESGAGQHAQYLDEAYRKAGAFIAEKTKILERCEFVLKVKCPLPEEYADYSADRILFTYLHFDENIPPERIKALIGQGFLGIAYEWVEKEGNYPLLEPMSKLTGHLFYQRSVELLARHKGILAGRYLPALEGATILIIGLGRIGTEVLKCALMNRLNIIVVARDPQQVELKTRQICLQMLGSDRAIAYPSVIPFDDRDPHHCKQQISDSIAEIDILINCAVRRPNLPKDKLEYLIDRAMIQKMQPHSIVCDATACDRDLIETCVSSELLEHYDTIDNIIHYSPDHIPAYVPKTATDMLTNATFEYVRAIANLGAKEAILSNEALRQGVSCYRGRIVHRYTAEKKGFEYVSILDLLNESPRAKTANTKQPEWLRPDTLPQSPQEVRQKYDKISATYDRFTREAEYRSPEAITALLEEIVANARYSLSFDSAILDAGCGTGLVGLALANAGFQNITGFDISENALGKAREKAVYTHLVQANLLDPLPFSEGCFTAVLCIGVFSRFSERQILDIVAEFSRLLRDDGLIVFSHRTDLLDGSNLMDSLQQTKHIAIEQVTSPSPYLPSAEGYEKITVQYLILRKVLSKLS